MRKAFIVFSGWCIGILSVTYLWMGAPAAVSLGKDGGGAAGVGTAAYVMGWSEFASKFKVTNEYDDPDRTNKVPGT